MWYKLICKDIVPSGWRLRHALHAVSAREASHRFSPPALALGEGTVGHASGTAAERRDAVQFGRGDCRHIGRCRTDAQTEWQLTRLKTKPK